MNYYVAHATSNEFVKSAGAARAHSSLVIGAPNFSAMICTVAHCYFMSREHTKHRFPSRSVGTMRFLFAFSAFAGVVGNSVHGLAINRGSVPLAVLGRFIMGFSSSEILHRQILLSCRPSHAVLQSSRLVYSRMIGIVVGLLTGCLAEAVPFTIKTFGIRSTQSASWLMLLLWLIHLIRVCAQFRHPRVDTSTIVAEITTDFSNFDQERLNVSFLGDPVGWVGVKMPAESG